MEPDYVHCILEDVFGERIPPFLPGLATSLSFTTTNCPTRQKSMNKPDLLGWLLSDSWIDCEVVSNGPALPPAPRKKFARPPALKTGARIEAMHDVSKSK